MTRLERRLGQTMQILMLIAVSCLHCLDATICMNFQLTICEQQMRIILYLRSLISPIAVCCCNTFTFLNCFASSGSQAGVYLCILGIFNRNIWNANSNGSGQTWDVLSRQDLCRSLKLKICAELKQLVIKCFLFRRFVMVSGILLLTYYKNYVFFFHNHVSQAAVLSLSFKNDVRFLDIL